jgi:anti-repressor protein
VATALGYLNPSKALTDHVDEEDKLNNESLSSNNESLSSLGRRGGWLINESGLYTLILSSKLPTVHGKPEITAVAPVMGAWIETYA